MKSNKELLLIFLKWIDKQIKKDPMKLETDNDDVVEMFLKDEQHSIIKFGGKMELEITKEKVLKAAEKCSEAKEVLKTLFPEIFADKYFDLSKLKPLDFIDFEGQIFTFSSSREAGFSGVWFFKVCLCGKYACKGFSLDKSYKWELVNNEFGELILLPTKKN